MIHIRPQKHTPAADPQGKSEELRQHSHDEGYQNGFDMPFFRIHHVWLNYGLFVQKNNRWPFLFNIRVKGQCLKASVLMGFTFSLGSQQATERTMYALSLAAGL